MYSDFFTFGVRSACVIFSLIFDIREIVMRKNAQRIKVMVAVAMFSALAYVSTLLCSFFPDVAGFLSLEIKDAVIVICSLLFGPLSGFLIAIIVPLLEFFTISATGWYGLVMNVLSSATFALVTGFIYKYKKTFYGAVIGLLAGIFSVTAVMMLANLFITPLYLEYVIGVPTSMSDILDMIPTILLPFNLVKATINAAIVHMLYMPVSTIMKEIGVVEISGDDMTINTKSIIRYIVVTNISAVIIVLSLVIIFLVIGK